MNRIPLRRCILYFAGLVVLAFGITLNTKTQLGVSPLMSVAYNVSEIWNLPFGVVSFVYYLFMILLQMLLLGKDFHLFQFAQVLTSFISSYFMQLFSDILPLFETTLTNILGMVVGIILTGTGAAMSVSAHLAPNPGDGLADAVGKRFRKDMGFGKNLIDFTALVCALIIGFVFTGGILGVGIGTAMAMLFTGRVIAVEFALVKKWKEGRQGI